MKRVVVRSVGVDHITVVIFDTRCQVVGTENDGNGGIAALQENKLIAQPGQTIARNCHPCEGTL